MPDMETEIEVEDDDMEILDASIGEILEPELDEDGNVVLPDQIERKSWVWFAMPVGGSRIVSVEDASSARSSANSFGKGTQGRPAKLTTSGAVHRPAKPAREKREFGSRMVKIMGPEGKPIKAVQIFRRS